MYALPTTNELTKTGATIAWGEACLMDAPRADRPDLKQTKVPVTCACGSVRWLTPCDARQDRPCAHCRDVERGKKGYKATMAKHGKAATQRAILASVTNRPSYAEEIVATWLIEAGIPFAFQQLLDTNPDHPKAAWFILDFVVGGELAIEVNGWGHKLPDRQRRDLKLRKYWTGELITITTDDLRNQRQVVRENLLNRLAIYATT